MGDNQGLIHNVSDGGVAADHPDANPLEFLVAPTTSSDFNTARLRLIPVACFRVDDIRFKFDSSFVLAGIQDELSALAKLMKANPGCPLSVFGHADPVGSDDYNKSLSGRHYSSQPHE